MDKESLKFSKFILGTEGQTKEFPYDISSLSSEDLASLGFTTLGTADFRLNE